MAQVESAHKYNTKAASIHISIAITVVLNGRRYGHRTAGLYGLHITDILIYNKPFSIKLDTYDLVEKSSSGNVHC